MRALYLLLLTLGLECLFGQDPGAELREQARTLAERRLNGQALPFAQRSLAISKLQFEQEKSCNAMDNYSADLNVFGAVTAALRMKEIAGGAFLQAIAIRAIMREKCGLDESKRSVILSLTESKVNLVELIIRYPSLNGPHIAADLQKYIQEVVELRSSKLGPENPRTLSALDTRGRYEDAQGNPEAVTYFDQVLKTAPVNSPIYLQSLVNRAIARSHQGHDEEALVPLQRALEVRLKMDQPDELEIASNYNDIATIQLGLGNTAEALKNHKLSLDIRERRLDADDPLLARSLYNLAADRLQRGADFGETELLLRRALRILKGLPPNDPDVMMARNNLMVVLRRRGGSEDLKSAREIGEELLGIYQQQARQTGRMHPGAGRVLHNLGAIAESSGDLARAAGHYSLATQYWLNVSPTHPEAIRGIRNNGLVAWRLGETKMAMDAFQQLSEKESMRMGSVLLFGKEKDKQAFLHQITPLDVMIQFQVQHPESETSVKIAFEDVLRKKGILASAMTDQMERLRATSLAGDVERLTTLNRIVSNCSALQVTGTESQRAGCLKKSLEAEEEISKIMQTVAPNLPPEYKGGPPIVLDTIRQKLNGRALVEFVRYFPIDPNRIGAKKEAKYIAYVLLPSGHPIPVPLGTDAEINTLVQKMLQSIGVEPKPGQRYDFSAARALDNAIMEPIRKVLGGANSLIISPDGDLNLVPFDALVDETDKELFDTFRITYYTSGRDLLRAPALTIPKGGDHLFTYVGYGPSIVSQPTSCLKGVHARSWTLLQKWSPAFSGLRVHDGYSASEESVRSLRNPRILHLDTHGFFCPDADLVAEPIAVVDSPHSSPADDPLLRSGIVLAAANQGGLSTALKSVTDPRTRSAILAQRPRGEDGILTAREATGLMLDGTELVILDGCQTGLGDIRDGDGVYGLRRAFQLAGARSQITSLWKLLNQPVLMQTFYAAPALSKQTQMSRAEALRFAQQQMRNNPAKRHPFYWAGLTFSGEDGTLLPAAGNAAAGQ